VLYGHTNGRPPRIDLTEEKAVHGFILAAAGGGLLRSAHDVAEGGMLVALAESCLLGGMGVRCSPLRPEGDVRLDAALFGESQGRFVVSAGSRALPELQTLARKHHVEIQILGLAGGGLVEFEGQVKVPLDELRAAWENGLA
jgi:phosphoribosylformylglycinamidine synthase